MGMDTQTHTQTHCLLLHCVYTSQCGFSDPTVIRSLYVLRRFTPKCSRRQVKSERDQIIKHIIKKARCKQARSSHNAVQNKKGGSTHSLKNSTKKKKTD